MSKLLTFKLQQGQYLYYYTVPFTKLLVVNKQPSFRMFCE